MSVPDHIARRRAQERERRRRAVRRRRVAAIVVLVAAVALVVALISGAFSGGSGGGGGHAGGTATAAAPAAAHTQTRTTVVARAQRPATGSYRGPVPILMYHVVTAPPPGTAYPELWTPRETFKATVALLRRKGYQGVTLGQAWRAWHGGPGLPRQPVVFSFDDGYLSQWAHAKPILRAAGWPGVLNLEGKNIGPGGLTRRQVRSMLAAGWEVDSHTLTHPDLTTVDDATLRREVADSRALLRRVFHIPVNFFCYPAGRNDARVRAAVRAAGYLAATTVQPGIASRSDDPYQLPRIRVNGTDTPQTVLANLRAGTASAGPAGG
ncbi:MAG TPA: polysaccharide deacetylase family protein [Solirubrobacteraceae bacterium]|nr:polysaccharide deacetylase family protein [Solirubrobacteraceae bacterium]